MKNAGSKKSGSHDAHGDGILPVDDPRPHLICHRGDHSPNTGLHAGKHLTDDKVVTERVVADRDQGDNEKRRDDRADDRRDRAGHPGQFITDHDRPVDGDWPRS